MTNDLPMIDGREAVILHTRDYGHGDPQGWYIADLYVQYELRRDGQWHRGFDVSNLPWASRNAALEFLRSFAKPTGEVAAVVKERLGDGDKHKGQRIKMYVVSSWRNLLQPAIVTMLRRCGHEVYDFRNPSPENHGFSWRTIHPDWENWTPQQYREALEHPIAKQGFEYDMNALRDCDACVLVLPSGRSASWEFGWAIGAGKKGAVVMFDKCEPELMYLGNPILTSTNELFDWAGEPVDTNFRGPLGGGE